VFLFTLGLFLVFLGAVLCVAGAWERGAPELLSGMYSVVWTWRSARLLEKR